MVSTGPTGIRANSLWSQARDPHPPCMRDQGSLGWKDLAKVLRRFRDARPTLGLSMMIQVVKWKKRALV